MTNSSYFFDNLIRYEDELSYTHFNHCINNLTSISSHLQKTFIFIDQYRRRINICNNNPVLSQLWNARNPYIFEEEIVFISKIPSEFNQLFAHITAIINDYILGHCNETENLFYFSFQLPLFHGDQKKQMIEFKAFPFLYTDLTAHRKPWLTFYECKPCDASYPGRLTLHIPNKTTKTYYLLKNNADYLPNYMTINDSDLKLFSLACQGFSESEIANTMQISIGALKRIKSAIMMYLNTQSTAHTIATLNNQGLL